MNKFALFTNDVETTSIWHNQLRDATGEKVLREGMPRLLEIYSKQNIKTTFFFTGTIARKFPDVVKMVTPNGHEVGCHGLLHETDLAFDVLSLEQQMDHLNQAKKILQDISGEPVVSFRAPALRVNQYTPKALTETGFLIDSSVAPQRFDMFMSFGSLKKMSWLTAPRLPYKTAPDNLLKKGEGPITEIPISALLMPYIGTTLRIFPRMTRLLRYLLYLENKRSAKPINFLFHPNEVIDESDEEQTFQKRAKNPISFILGDVIRSRLKIKNLGEKALTLLEKEITFFKDKNYQFTTLQEYCRINGFIK